MYVFLMGLCVYIVISGINLIKNKHDMVIAATNERPPQGKIKFTLKMYAIMFDSFRLFL